MSDNKQELENLLPKIQTLLKENLKLKLYPDKIFIRTLSSGVDFLGWVNFPNHRVLRTITKKRMFKNIKVNSKDAVVNSYLGLIR